jgi:O-antigen/teichoic acid export membrane protein
LWLSIAAGLASAIGLWILGPIVLELFGRGYSVAGSEALFALPLTLFGVAIKGHYVTIHRVRGTVSVATRVVAVAAVMEVVGGYIGGRIDGLRGLGIGVVVAIALESIPMLPILYREIIRPGFARWRAASDEAPAQ